MHVILCCIDQQYLPDAFAFIYNKTLLTRDVYSFCYILCWCCSYKSWYFIWKGMMMMMIQHIYPGRRPCHGIDIQSISPWEPAFLRKNIQNLMVNEPRELWIARRVIYHLIKYPTIYYIHNQFIRSQLFLNKWYSLNIYSIY